MKRFTSPQTLKGVGKTDFDLFPKLVARRFRQNDLTVDKQGKPLINEIHAVGFLGQAMKWAYSSKFPLRDRTGRVIGVLTINELYNDVIGEEGELNRLLPAIKHVTEQYATHITVAAAVPPPGTDQGQSGANHRPAAPVTPRLHTRRVSSSSSPRVFPWGVPRIPRGIRSVLCKRFAGQRVGRDVAEGFRFQVIKVPGEVWHLWVFRVYQIFENHGVESFHSQLVGNHRGCSRLSLNCRLPDKTTPRNSPVRRQRAERRDEIKTE